MTTAVFPAAHLRILDLDHLLLDVIPALKQVLETYRGCISLCLPISISSIGDTS